MQSNTKILSAWSDLTNEHSRVPDSDQDTEHFYPLKEMSITYS